MASKSQFTHVFSEHCQLPTVRWPPAFCSIPSALLELHGGDQSVVLVNR
jgi:hypothetical protein